MIMQRHVGTIALWCDGTNTTQRDVRTVEVAVLALPTFSFLLFTTGASVTRTVSLCALSLSPRPRVGEALRSVAMPFVHAQHYHTPAHRLHER